jgi:hypothetical protein
VPAGALPLPQELAASFAGRTVLVVTHGEVSRPDRPDIELQAT